MNIVILGAGKIGSYLASVLSKEEHNVILIDNDPKKIEKISREADIATVVGSGSDWKILDSLLEHNPAVFMAMTGNDEVNMIACTIAKNLGYPRTIARIKDVGFLTRSRLDFGRLFFVDHFIGAEIIVAHDILKNIIHPKDILIENFAHGTIQMRTFIIPDSWDRENIPISNLKLPEELLISLILRREEEEEKIIFPHGDNYLRKGDEITVIGEAKAMHEIHSFFDIPEKEVKSVVIVGGTDIALHLASILEKLFIGVKIIEKNEQRCEELANLLAQSTILNDDGTNINFLHSENVSSADAFVACTSKDANNILTSLIGKEIGCKQVIALLSDTNLPPILRKLDINFAVSEKVNIADRILSIIHAKTAISIASLYENKAKVLELKVSPESQLVGIPIAELSVKLPKDLLIAAIENRGRVMIGKGSRIISPNDTVILISSPRHLHEMQELF